MFSAIDWVLKEITYFVVMGIDNVIILLAGIFGFNANFTNNSAYQSSINFFFYDTMKIFLMLAVIIFIISIIRSFFPPEKTRKLLGEGKGKGVIGNILAALLGIVTPFCSCSAVPVFIGFIEAGIPLGITFSFLISSPMINEIALVMLWGMFGWKIALLYIGTGLVVAIVSGIIIGKLKLERFVEEYVYEIKIGEGIIVTLSWKDRISNAAVYVGEIIKKIWPYVIIGIGVGAVMHGWAPEGFLAKYASRENPLSVIVAVLIGVPLYSNAAGTIPIVSELTRMGIPMGTALSFMMAVTALSLPEMIILRKVLKPKLLAIFISIMTVTIIMIGYLFNLVLG